MHPLPYLNNTFRPMQSLPGEAISEKKQMIKYKEGVIIGEPALAGMVILVALRTISSALGLNLTITSGYDGEHGAGSILEQDPHYTGEAYDVRSHDFTDEQKIDILVRLRQLLGVDMFYAFLENPGLANEHFHIQRRKGRVLTIEYVIDNFLLVRNSNV